MTETKVTHEIKLDRSVRAILWALAIGVILHALPLGMIESKAFAELSGNPKITVHLQEDGLYNVDLDD